MSSYTRIEIAGGRDALLRHFSDPQLQRKFAWSRGCRPCPGIIGEMALDVVEAGAFAYFQIELLGGTVCRAPGHSGIGGK